jgi:hypothetical protein
MNITKLIIGSMLLVFIGCVGIPSSPDSVPPPIPCDSCPNPTDSVSVPCRVIVVLQWGITHVDTVGSQNNFGCRLKYDEIDRLLKQAYDYFKEKANIELQFEKKQNGTTDVKLLKLDMKKLNGTLGEIRTSRNGDDFEAYELAQSRFGNDHTPVVYNNYMVNIFFTGNIRVTPGALGSIPGFTIDPFASNFWNGGPYPYVLINDCGENDGHSDVEKLLNRRTLPHELGHYFLRKRSQSPYSNREHLSCSLTTQPCGFLMSIPPDPDYSLDMRKSLYEKAFEGHCEPWDMWFQAMFYRCTCPALVPGCDYQCLP